MLLLASVVPSSSFWWSDPRGVLHTVNHKKVSLNQNFYLISDCGSA